LTDSAVTRVDPGNRRLELAGGASLEADAILLATGGRARRFPGCADLEQVYYLRDWDDAMRLRQVLRPGKKAVVIGSGFIGAEVAASMATAGCQVELIEALPTPFAAIASAEIRASLAAAHAAAGVCIHAGVKIEGISATSAGVRIVTSAGPIIEADFVVVGIGLEPRVELAAAAGAEIAHGIVVDAQFKTSVPGLYAAGDVASVRDATGNLHRAEHWRSAQEQGAAAALAMLGRETPPAPVAWCWSDQYAHKLELAGAARQADRQIVRRMGEHEICAFHLRDGVLVGATGLNTPRLVRGAMSMIAKGVRPDLVQLADSGRPLNKIDQSAPQPA